MAKKPGGKKKSANNAVKSGDTGPQSSGKTTEKPVQPANMALSAATILLSAAAAVGILMIIAVFALPDGEEAASAIGGFPSGIVAERTMQWFMLLDTLFPLFYGAGLAALATGLQSRGSRPVIRLILLAILLGVMFDFAENAAIVAGQGENAIPVEPARTLTILKYTTLAFAGVLISVAMPPSGWVGIAAKSVARYLFPVGVAVLVSGIGGENARTIVGAGFPVALILVAVYAQSLIEAKART